MTQTGFYKRPLVLHPASPSNDYDDDCSLGDCSLDDVHRAFRESHKSHGLSSGSTVSHSFHFSADLTSVLGDDSDEQHLLDDGEDDANSVALSVMRRVSQSPSQAKARPQQQQRRSATFRHHSPSSDHSVSDDQSAAPSVVRNSRTLTSAALQADRALAKLESFLQSDGSTTMGGDGVDGNGDDVSVHSGMTGMTGMTELRNSEKELNGLFRSASGASIGHDYDRDAGGGSNYDDMSSVGSGWQMMGDAGGDNNGDDSSVMTESSLMVGSIMGSVMLGSIMEGGSNAEESKDSGDPGRHQAPSNWDRRKICLARELEAVNVPNVPSSSSSSQGHHHGIHFDDDDDLSVLSMGEAQPQPVMMMESATLLPPVRRPSFTPSRHRSTSRTSSPTPALKRGSLLSTFSVSSGLMKELEDLYDDDDEDDDDDDEDHHQEPVSSSLLPIEIGMSPIGYVSFDSVSKHSRSNPDLASLGAKSSSLEHSYSSATHPTAVPCLESYQQSTEDGDEIFHNAASEFEDEQHDNDHDEEMTMTVVAGQQEPGTSTSDHCQVGLEMTSTPTMWTGRQEEVPAALIGTKEFIQHSVTRTVASKQRQSDSSASRWSFETFYAYAEHMAEFLYG